MSWEVKKLGEVCKITMGQSPSSDTYNRQNIGLPFFQGKAEFTELYPVPQKYCSHPKKIAEPLDILLSVRAPVGATNIANEKCCIGRGLASLTFENYKYGHFFLKSISQQLDEKGTGTTFKAISGETIRETLIPYPDLQTQDRVVVKIEELFSELDKGVEEIKRAQEQVKVYRQSVLKWAFEGKLTNEQVKDGELPKGWGWKKMRNLGNWKGGGTPSKQNKSFWTNGTNLWVSSKDMKSRVILDSIDKITDEAIEKSSAKRISENAILFVMRSGILRHTLPVAIAGKNLTVNQDIQSIEPFDFIESSFLYWYVVGNNQKIRQECSKDGTTVESIDSQSLKDHMIPIPSMKEQKLIVQEIESRLSLADQLEKELENSLLQAEALRQSILKKAFEGELVE